MNDDFKIDKSITMNRDDYCSELLEVCDLYFLFCSACTKRSDIEFEKFVNDFRTLSDNFRRKVTAIKTLF